MSVPAVVAGRDTPTDPPARSSPKLPRHFGAPKVLVAIRNRDRIARLHAVPTRVVSVEQLVRNERLAESLKTYYEYRCQICGHGFQPTYGVDVPKRTTSSTWSQGGPDVSTNMVVICPNHHRIIHTTHAAFNRQMLTYEYPNGLREPLIRPDHFQGEPVQEIQAS